MHDIGLHAVRDDAGEVGFRVIVGGGMGRTPIIGHVIREFLPWRHLLTYLEAILRVYNRYGRRDNMYKARIKILVKELGAGGVRARRSRPSGRTSKDGPVDADRRRKSSASTARFTPPAYETLPATTPAIVAALADRPRVRRWAERNVHAAQGAGLRGGDAVAQEDRRAAGRRDRRRRWTRSPTSPTATASASCASRTSRT